MNRASTTGSREKCLHDRVDFGGNSSPGERLTD
jgi:hypothetical protein